MKQNKNNVILQDTNLMTETKQTFAKEVLQGLKQQKKSIPGKYAYDEVGSQIYERIQQFPAYYPFKCDREIIETHCQKMLELIGKQKFNLVDLGAGDGVKTQILIQKGLQKGYDFTYLPLDISLHANENLQKRLKQQLPNLAMTTITAEFDAGINWIQNNKPQKNVYFFLGGTIGAMTESETHGFFSMLKKYLRKGDMFFMTADLWKNPIQIKKAYQNKHVKQMFDNLLNRMNKQLNANFIVDKFYPYMYFDPYEKSIRGNLISSENQQVTIAGQQIKLKKAQVINITVSRKLLQQDIIELCKQAEMHSLEIFRDHRKYMAMFAFQKKQLIDFKLL